MDILHKIDNYLEEALDLDAIAKKETKFTNGSLLKLKAVSKLLKLSV